MKYPNLEDFKNIKMQFVVDATTLLCIISQVQLATRHPHNNGPVKDIATDACKKFQKELVRLAPELNEIIEAGWNPDFDF